MPEGRRPLVSPAHGEVSTADPRAALAALVAVIRRRTLLERITVSGDAEIEIDLSADPTFAELTRLVSATLGTRFTVCVEGVELTADGNATSLRADADADHVRLTSQVLQALADGERTPARRVSVLELASHADRAHIATLEGSGEPAAPARCLHELVDDQARRTPRAVALSTEDSELDYSQLVAHADALAAVLTLSGVRPGQVVGVLGERSPGLIVALLAVLKTGAAYLALAPDWPDARLAQLLRGARADTVLTPAGLADRLPEEVTAVLFTPDPAPDGASEEPPHAPQQVRVSPDGLAYVSYTSGSTGEPKGVCVPHAAVSRLVCSPDWAEFGPGDVFLQAAPVSFDASTLEIWAPLCNGGRLALLPPGRLDLSRTGRFVRSQGVTVLWLTAGLFHQMVEHQLEQLAGVRHLIAGGDVLNPPAVARLLDAHPQMRFSNGYGPTENTTFTACAALQGTLPEGPVPIGHPISGTRIRVLDPEGKAVPTGVAGELHAGGAGLAHGYLGTPAATAERFVPDPGGAQAGGRLYRTGDLARWRPDGMLDFLGRMDGQVKVNGYRVEPGEIENVLTGHPGVEAAAVVEEQAAGDGKQLVAYAVPAVPEEVPSEEGGLARELSGWLRERLPGHLMPSRITTLAELPLTSNGKVDRAALPTMQRAPRSVHNEYVAPESPVERFLCGLWEESLKIDRVGVEDDFFELGGHSLIAADLLARLQREFGVDLPARMLYLSPTVGELAELDELDKLRARLS